jgi:hypothetical protein
MQQRLILTSFTYLNQCSRWPLGPQLCAPCSPEVVLALYAYLLHNINTTCIFADPAAYAIFLRAEQLVGRRYCQRGDEIQENGVGAAFEDFAFWPEQATSQARANSTSR